MKPYDPIEARLNRLELWMEYEKARREFERVSVEYYNTLEAAAYRKEKVPDELAGRYYKAMKKLEEWR